MGAQITRNNFYDSLGGPFQGPAHCCPRKAGRCAALQRQCAGGLSSFPLRFHPSAKGSQILMDRSQRSVRRQASFCNGLTFSNRPVALYEQVRLKITKRQCCWSGALRMGFTTTDPSRMSPDLLPKYACPDLVCQRGFWAKALPENLCAEGSLISFWLDKRGRVFYRVNECRPLLFFTGVPASEPVWALIDVYGLTRGVQLLDSEMAPGACLRPHSMRQDVDDWRLSVSLRELRLRAEQLSSSSYSIPQNSLNSQHSSVLPTHLRADLHFHSTHGSSLRLLDDDTVCRHGNERGNHSLVFTHRPLRSGECMFLKVALRSSAPTCHTSLTYGVTSCNPAQLHPSDLPANPNDLLDRREFWVVGPVATPLQGGDILGFWVTAEGEVLLSHNGGGASRLMCVDHSRPLWMLFHMGPTITQLSLLGSSGGSSSPRSPSCLWPSDSDQQSLGTLNSQSGLHGISSSQSASDNININQSARHCRNSSTGTTPSSPASLPESPSFPSCSAVWGDECTICCEKAVDTVVYACGHMCLCYTCGLRLKSTANACCPICRRTIKDIIKTYRST